MQWRSTSQRYTTDRISNKAGPRLNPGAKHSALPDCKVRGPWTTVAEAKQKKNKWKISQTEQTEMSISGRTAKQWKQKLTNAHRFDEGVRLWESCDLTRATQTRRAHQHSVCKKSQSLPLTRLLTFSFHKGLKLQFWTMLGYKWLFTTLNYICCNWL